MDEQELIQQFKQMPWTVWLYRRFRPFLAYIIMKGATPEAFAKEGIKGQFPIALYDTDDWYGTPEMFELAAKEAARYLKEKNIFTIVEQCEVVLEQGRKLIPALSASNENSRALFQKAMALIDPVNVYIWIAHASEAHYLKQLREAARQYVPEAEVDKFVGDISFPAKKNSLAQMEDDIRAGLSVAGLHAKYAWIKSRGGFLSGYTMKEMAEIQTKILMGQPETRMVPTIPFDLQPIATEAQELVYLRTLRTDVLYELLYLAQPILSRFAESLGIASVADYVPDELLSGNFTAVPREYAIIKCNDQVITVRESIVTTARAVGTQVAGVVAQKGMATGTARVLYTVNDLSKVEIGDIIVTNMTTPAYISAMQRAAAFVTDEGGITCHAAIIAREMRKPCITGTRTATHIFKDGDRVEVDAERGIVRKI